MYRHHQCPPKGINVYTTYVNMVLVLTNFSFRIDDEAAEEMKKYKGVNWSDVARKAIRERLEQERRYEHRVPEGFPWRTISYKGDTITVNAELGEFGPTNWSLEIRSNKLEKPLIVELGGMPWLDRTIKGVADYFFHKNLRTQKIDLSKTLSKDMLSDLWLRIGKWARKNNLELSADVALLPPQPIRVHGRHGQVKFDDEVTPKKWGDVKRDEDQINVFFSNFWIGSYAQTHGTVFRLSSYLTREMGIFSAKTATRYIDFHPDDLSDEAEIKRLIAKATVVYLPDLSLKNVRSIFFESTDS